MRCKLIGNPDIALLIGVIFSFFTLGTMQGFSRETILKFSNECLAPTATITLLMGAGGGLGAFCRTAAFRRRSLPWR